MGNIVLLDDLTINKIAAGEVIERPASVVKELVENSIDAGATSITVEIKNGGNTYIRITDNGKGFEKDDMEIAFERHATSKIRSADDLPKAKSMGFRGEALASIAAISRVELKSKTMNSNVGNKIVLEGGKVLEFMEEGCPNGSTITIENLFYNTPVRYKFLKKDFTEAGYIEDAVTRIALANPDIAIKLINTGKTVIQTSGNNDIKSVIYNIYGKEVAQNILDVNYEYEDIKVTGVVGKPEIARSNRSNQLFFVNKRYVKDKTLSAASEQAFKGVIPMGKFAFLILNLSMDTEKVDVNVHPAKLEVRFEEEAKIFKAVYNAIKGTIFKDGQNLEIKKEDGPLLEKKDFGNFKADDKKDYKHFVNKYKIQEKSTPKKFENGETLKLGLLQKLLNRNKMQENYEEKIEEQDENEIEENNFIAQIYQKRNKLNEDVEVEEKEEDIEDIKIDNGETQIIDVPKQDIKIEEEIKETETNNIEKTQVINIAEIIEKEEINNNLEENKVENVEEQFEDKSEEVQDNIEQINEKEPEIIEAEKEEVKLEEEKPETIEPKKEENLYETNSFNEIYSSIFGVNLVSESKVEEEPEKYIFDSDNFLTNENVSIFEDKEEFNKIKYKLVGTAFNKCYLLEIGQDLYIIDQKVAREKALYEELKKDYNLNKLENKSTLMLLPDIIELNKKQMEIAKEKENIDMYKKAGFEFDEFGENTIKLNKVPDICLELDTKELFIETLNKINTVSMIDRQQVEEKLIQTLAKQIVKNSKTILSKEETENLLDRLLNSKTPFINSNGEQIAIKMTRAEIEKRFSRR